MTKSIKVNKDTTTSIASGITGAPSGAEAFSRAKSVDNFQKARIRAFCFQIKVLRYRECQKEPIQHRI